VFLLFVVVVVVVVVIVVVVVFVVVVFITKASSPKHEEAQSGFIIYASEASRGFACVQDKTRSTFHVSPLNVAYRGSSWRPSA
jgi:flagellar basal body-associated protein FliL